MAGSKKYKNKLCVYCRDAIATTADHVFPREMFQIHQWGMLPKVPACVKCNNEKANLELYLLSVLPFGATHTHANTALSIDTRRRLQRNHKLRETIKESFGNAYIPISKYQLEQRMCVRFDGDILHEFIGFVCRGLLWHHWNRYLPNDSTFVAFTPSRSGVDLMSTLINMRSSFMVNTEL